MNFYEIMEVGITATNEEIKKNYRKLAMKYHPDRNPGDKEAENKFKELQSAYDTLNNEQKRRIYDNKKPYKAEPKPKPKEDNRKNAFGINTNPSLQELDAIQCSFFGSTGMGRNIQAHVKIPKNTMKLGGIIYVEIKKRELCKVCIGDGSQKKRCNSCHGAGKQRQSVVSEWGYGSYNPTCRTCDGFGAIDYPCNNCQGSGVKQWIIKEVKVTIPSDSKPGQQITVQGEGEHYPNKQPGYLRVVLLEE